MITVAQVLIAISLLPWLLIAAFSVMLFDAPGSTGNPFTVWLAASILCYGPAAIAGLIKSRPAAGQTAPRPRWLLLPVLALLSAVLAAVLIELRGGRLN